MIFTFDKEKHEYFVDGKQVQSITGCMKSAGVIENTYGTDYDLWVGTATHRAIELRIKGTLDMDALDPELRPRITAWDRFVAMTNFLVIASERSVYSVPLRCAGTLDIFGVFPDQTEGIIEIKSGNVSRWAGVQTAGQDLLLGGKMRKRFGLKIPKDGEPSIKTFTDPDDYAVFRSAVTIANWKNK